MSKFITFTKLVDSNDLMINMDSVSNMVPVRKLYSGQMVDCTDLYYEDHRITVVASLNSILEAMSNIGDDGSNTGDLSLTHDELDPNAVVLPESDIQYTNITITGYRENPDENYVIFLAYQYEQKPFGEDNDAYFTKTLHVPEGQNYVYVVYVDLFEGSSAAGWAIKDNSGNIGVFANLEDAENFISEDSVNFGLASYHYGNHGDPIKVPLDVAFDLINDHYDDFDLPISVIYSHYEIRKYGNNDNNAAYMSFAKTFDQARNLLPYVNPNNLYIPSSGEPADGVYRNQFSVTPVAENNHTYYVVLVIHYKRRNGRVTTTLHSASPIKIFSYESDADAYISEKSVGLDVSQTAYEYKKFSLNIGHLYKYGYFSSGLSFVEY